MPTRSGRPALTPARLAAVAAICAATPALLWADEPPGAALAPAVTAQDTPVGAVTDLAGAPTAMLPIENGVRAQGIALVLTGGLGETDNVALTTNNTQSQTLGLLGADFMLNHISSGFDVAATGDVAYIDYLQNAYSAQFLGRFDALAALKFFSDRLRWVVDEDFGEAQLNVFSPIVPGNLEFINVVGTGPDLVLRTSSDYEVRAGARYLYATYEESPFNGDRAVADVSIVRELSANSNVGLNADGSWLWFQNTVVNTDYNRRKFYASFDTRGARTQLSVELGVMQVSEFGSATTPLAQLNLTRSLTSDASVFVAAGREYTDSADNFRDLHVGAAGGIVVSPTAAATTDNYLTNYVTGGWSFQRNRTTLSLTARWERDTYTHVSSADVQLGNIQARISRIVSPSLSWELYAAVNRSEYLVQHPTQTFGTGGAALVYNLGRTVDCRLSYGHNFQGTSGVGAVPYAEDRVFVSVNYRPPLTLP
jgi:hypothetical protein